MSLSSANLDEEFQELSYFGKTLGGTYVLVYGGSLFFKKQGQNIVKYCDNVAKAVVSDSNIILLYNQNNWTKSLDLVVLKENFTDVKKVFVKDKAFDIDDVNNYLKFSKRTVKDFYISDGELFVLFDNETTYVSSSSLSFSSFSSACYSLSSFSDVSSWSVDQLSSSSESSGSSASSNSSNSSSNSSISSQSSKSSKSNSSGSSSNSSNSSISSVSETSVSYTSVSFTSVSESSVSAVAPLLPYQQCEDCPNNELTPTAILDQNLPDNVLDSSFKTVFEDIPFSDPTTYTYSGTCQVTDCCLINWTDHQESYTSGTGFNVYVDFLYDGNILTINYSVEYTADIYSAGWNPFTIISCMLNPPDVGGYNYIEFLVDVEWDFPNSLRTVRSKVAVYYNDNS